MAEIHITDPSKFTPGQEVFTTLGTEAEYIRYLPGEGHLVRAKIYYGDEDEETGEMDFRWGNFSVQRELYEDGMVAVTPLEQMVAKLQAEASRLQLEINQAGAGLKQAKEAAAAEVLALSNLAALKNLAKFIAGEITHFVTIQWGGQIRIQTFAETVNTGDMEYNSWPKVPEQRLLSLFGSSKGDLAWRLSSYRDNSGGSWMDVHPCCSLEEAQEKAGELLAIQFADWRAAAAKGANYSNSTYTGESAARLGVELPSDLAEILQRAKRQHALNTLTAARKAAAEAESAARAAGVVNLEVERG